MGLLDHVHLQLQRPSQECRSGLAAAAYGMGCRLRAILHVGGGYFGSSLRRLESKRLG